MTEIRFHGRGGQGVVVASEILASAFFQEGKFVQAFPTFGVERRGAPVAAFLRVALSPIRLRCQIGEPDHVVILDSTLLSSVNPTTGLKPDGWVLLNSDKSPGHFTDFHNGGWQVACVDASRVAVTHGLGSATNPIVNTAILGAFARITGLLELDSVLLAIEEGVPLKQAENRAAAEEAFRLVRQQQHPETRK